MTKYLRVLTFDVYLHGRWLDRVHFEPGTTIDEVRDSLIYHDGMDHRITVIRSESPPATENPGRVRRVRQRR